MKSLKRLIKIVFSRFMLAIISLFFQLFIIFFSFCYFSKYIMWIFAIFIVLSIIITIYILNKKENQIYKNSWVLLVLIFPIFGVCLYILLNIQPEKSRIFKRIKMIQNSSRKYLIQNKNVFDDLRKNELTVSNFSFYMNNCCNFPIYQNTKAIYFPSGKEFFNDLLNQLKTAKKYIFLEYFIIEDGIMWNKILEILKEKAKEGVEIKILYDGMCSIILLPSNYPKKLKDFGINCKVVFPIKPFFLTYQNNRDHRKICVIDGEKAYTGGINLADEYINLKKKFGYWKDTTLKIEGPAVDTFTILFLEMWNLTEKDQELYEKYLFGRSCSFSEKEGYVLPYGDSPYDKENIGKNVYLDILFNSKNYIHIITPYLILDNELISSLIYSAKKGVEVIIILPHIPDKKLIYYLGRSYYLNLLDAGVKIYEYTPGFCHAKVFISDLDKAIVSSINLDYRSLYLHFESGIFLYQNQVISDIEKDFQNTLSKCQKITKSEVINYPLCKRMIGRILRIFAPLL